MRTVEITADVRATPGLYAARCPDSGLVKIGQTNNVARRLAQHRVAPFRLVPAVALYTPPPTHTLEVDAFRQLHADRRREYHPIHAGSEWADLSDDEIKTLFHWLVVFQQVKRLAPVKTEEVPVVLNVYDGISHYRTQITTDLPLIEPGVVPRSR